MVLTHLFMFDLNRRRSSESIQTHYTRTAAKSGSRTRNASIPSSVKSLGKWWAMKFVCTHGWDLDRKRGKGATVTQKWRSTGCKAGFWVRVVPVDDPCRPFQLQSKLVVTEHNHNVNKTIWMAYVENRRIDDKALINEVGMMRSVGGKLRNIVQHLRGITGIILACESLYCHFF